MGRAVRVVVVLLVDVFVYITVLSFSLRFGPEGLGPRVSQLSLALGLPAAITYGALWNGRRLTSLLKPVIGMTAAGFLTPSILSCVPVASLACSLTLLMAPYYVPSHLLRSLRRGVRRAHKAGGDVESSLKLDLLLLKRHVYYFRWYGTVPEDGRCEVVRAGDQRYLRVASFALSDRSCRAEAFTRALATAKAWGGVIVPATGKEAECLESGALPEKDVLLRASEEKMALAGLSVATKRTLTCALEGIPSSRCRAADVIIRGLDGVWSVKVLSGKRMEMDQGRLRDLLDLYKMVASE